MRHRMRSFGGSQDPLDFYNYEDIYNTVKQGYDVSYEIGYVWLNDICGKLGCSYIEFRYIAGIYLFRLINNHKKTDGTSECSMEFLPYFSAMFDACLLRNSMALIIAIIAILLLVRARSTKEYLFSAGLIALAALFHSAYWVLLFSFHYGSSSTEKRNQACSPNHRYYLYGFYI